MSIQALQLRAASYWQARARWDAFAARQQHDGGERELAIVEQRQAELHYAVARSWYDQGTVRP